MAQLRKARNEESITPAEIIGEEASGEEAVSQQVTEEPAPVCEGERSGEPERRESLPAEKGSEEKVTMSVKLQHRDFTRTVIYGDGHGDIFM